MPSIELLQRPKRTPYGARVRFLLGEDVKFKFDGPVSLVVSTTQPVELNEAKTQPYGHMKGFKRYNAKILGFATAEEAERAGERLALGFLWAAVSKRFSLQLDYSTSNRVLVFDRTDTGSRIGVSAHATATWNLNPNHLCELVCEVLDRDETIDRALILSMELFAGARLELTERARFLTMVSALEPLADQHELPGAVSQFVDDCLAELDNQEIPFSASLAGRLRSLKKESVRQAILRVVRELLPDAPTAVDLADEVYGLRSDILHEGASDPYLPERTASVENLMRRLYAARLGLDLATPANL